jgi:uncharacterized damage-inducible protein DinB
MVSQMPRSPLTDAFDHHVWATTRLIDACSQLSQQQLASAAPGTYGTILDTFRHLVESDRWYLTAWPHLGMQRVDGDSLDLAAARSVMVDNGNAWSRLLAEQQDTDEIVPRPRADGSEHRAPTGVRLAQVLHHGTDHRSQICTILTTLGVEPPEIDVWEFGMKTGRSEEVPAPAKV